MPDPPLDVFTLTEGGQSAELVAEKLSAFLSAAERTLDLALYDVRLPGAVGDAVAGVLRDAAARGVAVRIAYNEDDPQPEPRPFEPPPPRTEPPILASLGVPLRAIPGWRDLMHHKYAVRDGKAVWTGSMNWTLDSWTRQENVVVTAEAEPVARAFAHNFEELWTGCAVEGTGERDELPATVGSTTVRAWFCPGRGPELSHRIAKRIGQARRRVRIASPLITAGPILGSLNEVLAEERVDAAGVCDATQVHQVFGQWEQNPRSRWKVPLLARIVGDEAWSGKRSTPWSPDTVHDCMHAKVTVADDTVFAGSFNLSRSGELNAENVLEIRDGALADRLAAWIDELRGRYADPVPTPPGAAGPRGG